jgi:exodeoxyribonuclease V gamma subunit
MAPGLFVHTSNRLEELLEALATVLAAEPLPPLRDEVVVVPSQGLARWLRLQLAERFGIAASLQLPFLGAFLQDLGRDPNTTTVEPLRKDQLLFRIWRVLRDPATTNQFRPAADYCADDPDERKRLQLCQRLARVFDDYQVYRPDLLARWRDGDDADELGPQAGWQARLWRRLLADAGFLVASDGKARAKGRREPGGPLLFRDAAPAAARGAEAIRLAAIRRQFAEPDLARTLLPVRLSVFGATSLPPAFLELLAAAAALVPVHLFVPEPAPKCFEATDNPWLAGFAAQAREFSEMLAELDGQGTAVHRFDLAALAGRTPPPRAHCTLHHLQQEIARTDPDVPAPPPFAITASDDSLRVHDCHSPHRELEVVRDQVLAAFAADSSLEPHDVFVLVPDIERYAPIAHAVFGPVAKHMPFHVADRNPANELPVCSALLAVLRLAHDRVEAPDVFRLLEEPAVHRRFGLFAGDLPMLRERIARAGIRWGVDGESRARTCQLPAFDDNAWLPGLRRLVLGVATGPVDDLVLGTLPVADTTSSRDEPLARLLAFTETLFARLDAFARPQSLPAWADVIDELLTAVFAAQTPDDATAIARVRAATALLRQAARDTGLTDVWTPTVLRDWLEQSLQEAATPRGFLAGAVTVAALMPMRTVPARCIFVCGLDDASFPRRTQALPFDLIAARRRPGDRDVRRDDRQLFLDVVLAARERLHFTYVGHSQKDDSECAPSVLLAELLDHVDRCCAGAGERKARAAIVVAHPLQPWSERYRRGDPRLFTYSQADLRPAAERGDEPAWFGPAAPAMAEPDTSDVPLDRLHEFWKQPCRFYLKHVCRIAVRDDDDADARTEPFALDNLEKWRVQDHIVRRAERPATPEHRLAVARASSLLPAFGHGDALFVELDDEAQLFLATRDRHGPRTSRRLRVRCHGAEIHGEIDGVTPGTVLVARMANVKPKDRLRGFVTHVAVALARHAGEADWPATTTVLGKNIRDDEIRRFRELSHEEADAAMRELLRGYREGSIRPLPFFPETSFVFAEKGKVAARRKWVPSQGGPNRVPSDSENASNALCFRGVEPLGSQFEAWAAAIWKLVGEYEVPQ